MALDPLTEFVTQSSSHTSASISLANSTRLGDVEEAARGLGRMAQGEEPTTNPIYGRLHNDTVSQFEGAMARVEHTESAVAFASGMAAITAVLMASRSLGTHIIAVRPLYGGTDHLFSSGLTGLEVVWARPEEIADLISPSTALVVAETPANPTLDLIDIEALAEDAGDVPLLVDSTFATPVLQNPARLGATLVVHSATKYIGGHGDVLGGVVATTEEWAARLRQIRIATGGVLHPMAAYLLRRGLATLPVRVEAAQKRAAELARRLQDHSQVARVYYPGLSGCDPQGLVGSQMSGPGAMISFEVHEEAAAGPVMELVEVITAAVSLGSTDSLIQHPASLTHQIVDEASRLQGGVSSRLLRLSVGLEHVEDLWADLDEALHRAAASIHHVSRPTRTEGRRLR